MANPVHRTGPFVDQSCENCLFWGWKEAKTGSGGICRRHAPAPRLKFAAEEMENFEPIAFAYWPDTGEDDWCGEWRSVQEAGSDGPPIKIELTRG